MSTALHDNGMAQITTYGLSISCLRSAICVYRKMLGFSKTASLSLNPIIACMYNLACRGVSLCVYKDLYDTDT